MSHGRYTQLYLCRFTSLVYKTNDHGGGWEDRRVGGGEGEEGWFPALSLPWCSSYDLHAMPTTELGAVIASRRVSAMSHLLTFRQDIAIYDDHAKEPHSYNNKSHTLKTLHNALHKYMTLSWTAFLSIFSLQWPVAYGLDTPQPKEPQDIKV